MNRISAVVFDMDGVIFDTERLCLDAWKILAERENMNGIEEVCIRCIGTTTPETIKILKSEYGEDLEIERLHKELNEIIGKMVAENGMPVKDGVSEILSMLKSRGVPTALASSTRYEKVCSQLKAAGFLEYFGVVIGGDMIEKSKPEPDIYLAACERLGTAPENTAAVEDSYNGIRSAHAAGMTTVMVPDIVQPNGEILKKVDFLCKNLLEAKDIIADRL